MQIEKKMNTQPNCETGASTLKNTRLKYLAGIRQLLQTKLETVRFFRCITKTLAVIRLHDYCLIRVLPFSKISISRKAGG